MLAGRDKWVHFNRRQLSCGSNCAVFVKLLTIEPQLEPLTSVTYTGYCSEYRAKVERSGLELIKASDGSVPLAPTAVTNVSFCSNQSSLKETKQPYLLLNTPFLHNPRRFNGVAAAVSDTPASRLRKQEVMRKVPKVKLGREECQTETGAKSD